MKLIAPLALTLATLTSAIPLRIILPASDSSPSSLLLPVSDVAPGPHHLHHLAPAPLDAAGGRGGFLPPDLKEELFRLSHLHQEGAMRVSSDSKNGHGRKPCHGGRKGKGRGGWLDGLFGGWGSGREVGSHHHHHQKHQEGGSMMVIEPDGSRTFIHTPSSDASSVMSQDAPQPHHARPIGQTLSLRIDEAFAALWSRLISSPFSSAPVSARSSLSSSRSPGSSSSADETASLAETDRSLLLLPTPLRLTTKPDYDESPQQTL